MFCRHKVSISHRKFNQIGNDFPDSKFHGANMGPTWVLSAPDGPHVVPMNIAIRGHVMHPTICLSFQQKACFDTLLSLALLYTINFEGQRVQNFYRMLVVKNLNYVPPGKREDSNKIQHVNNDWITARFGISRPQFWILAKHLIGIFHKRKFEKPSSIVGFPLFYFTAFCVHSTFQSTRVTMEIQMRNVV